jgi:hypothetical protein
MERLIFLDIETIPAGDPIDPMTLKPPAQMKKADTIAEWYKNEAPALAEEAWKKGSLDSMRGEILCIGWICDEEGWVINGSNEEATLQQFQTILEGIKGEYKFVGWNINSFDIPWIWRKAIKYNLPLRKVFNRDRYRGNSVDLMLTWASDFKDFRKMSDVAEFLGIEDRSNGIEGSQVYDLYKEGRIEEIKTYCMGDVETVRDIYKRIYE